MKESSVDFIHAIERTDSGLASQIIHKLLLDAADINNARDRL
jgi:hypothetical protein